jgi:hypothetical protein
MHAKIFFWLAVFFRFTRAPILQPKCGRGDAAGGALSSRDGCLHTTFPRVFIAAYSLRARSARRFSSSAMAEEPAAPEAKKSDTFQFPDGSKYGLPPPLPAATFILRLHHQLTRNFPEGEYEEVAGQEEGSIKRVRQVTPYGPFPPLSSHWHCYFRSTLALALLTPALAMQGFGMFTHVSGNVYAPLLHPPPSPSAIFG